MPNSDIYETADWVHRLSEFTNSGPISCYGVAAGYITYLPGWSLHLESSLLIPEYEGEKDLIPYTITGKEQRGKKWNKEHSALYCVMCE